MLLTNWLPYDGKECTIKLHSQNHIMYVQVVKRSEFYVDSADLPDYFHAVKSGDTVKMAAFEKPLR